MPALGAGHFGKMVYALLDGGAIDKILSDKLEKLGEDLLMKSLAGPFAGVGNIERISEALKTGGTSEFERLGENWLRALQPPKVVSSAYTPLRRRVHGQHGQLHKQAWSRTDWARSRDDWLDNRWQHDWRSQPRDVRGRWMPGRLEYVAANMQYRGSRKGRVKRRKAQLKRAARTRGRRAARKLFKQMRKQHAG